MAAPSRISGRALADLLPDLTELPGPVYGALAHAVTALVLDGRIVTETRLPSERELAAALSLSRATVTAAYDSLRTEGYLDSRTGSGSYVAVPRTARPRTALSRWSSGHHDPRDVIDLSCAALPAPPHIVEQAVARATERLAPHLLGDGYEPSGLPALRDAIAARFVARGVPTTPDQILVTNGALHGLDLLLRLLLGPGDRVVTELPSYPGGFDAVRAHGGRIVPAPMHPDGGWQIGQLQATFRQSAAKLAYLTPDFHNPTGALMSDDDRRAVLRSARQAGTTVIVDESFVGLGFRDAATPAAAIDRGVITLGSLSKPIWGGLRVGWVRASTDLVHRLAALRTSVDMGGAVLDQLVASVLVEDLDRIAAQRVAELRPRRDALVAALATDLPSWRVTAPDGGLSLWVELPAPLSTPLTMLAAQTGVVLVPGSRFGIDGTLERFLRLPFAQPERVLVEAVHRLASIWARLDGSASASELATRRLVVA